MAEILNIVKDFGAVPNVNNEVSAVANASAMKQALDAGRDGYVSIYVPAGKYYSKAFGPAYPLNEARKELGAVNIFGDGMRRSVFSLYQGENTGLFVCEDQGDWHDGEIRNIGFEGNLTSTDPVVSLFGYSVSVDNLFVKNGGGDGLLFGEGQSYSVGFLKVQDCAGYGVVFDDVLGCVVNLIDTERHGSGGVLVKSTSGTRSVSPGVIINHVYSESTPATIELRGMSGVKVCGVTSPSGHDPVDVHLKRDQATGKYSTYNLIDLRNGAVKVKVDQGCLGNTILLPKSLSDDYQVIDADGRNMYSVDAVSPFNSSPGEDFSGTIYYPNTNAFDLQIGSADVVGGSILHPALAYRDSLNRPAHVQWTALNSPVANFFAIDTNIPQPADTEFYLYALIDIDPDIKTSVRIFNQSDPVNKYYDFYANDGSYLPTTEQSDIVLLTTGRLQFVRIPFKSPAETMRARAYIITSRGNAGSTARFYWAAISDNPYMGIVSKKNGDVIGNGDVAIFDEDKMPPAGDLPRWTKIYNKSRSKFVHSNGTEWV